MIHPESRPQRGPHISATPDSTLANPEQIIAELQLQLAERRAERDEALEQQTATAEVLQVINPSPGDLAPVFDVILEEAMQLCDAAFGVMQKYDGGRFYPVALLEVPPAYSEFLLREPLKFAPDTALGRIEAGEDVISSADAAVDYRQASALIRTLQGLGGIRSVVFVSLRKDGALLGVMTYAFTRIGAVVGMRVEDYYPAGKRWWVRLHEKGGKRHQMPAHHKLEA